MCLSRPTAMTVGSVSVLTSPLSARTKMYPFYAKEYLSGTNLTREKSFRSLLANQFPYRSLRETFVTTYSPAIYPNKSNDTTITTDEVKHRDKESYLSRSNHDEQLSAVQQIIESETPVSSPFTYLLSTFYQCTIPTKQTLANQKEAS